MNVVHSRRGVFTHLPLIPAALLVGLLLTLVGCSPSDGASDLLDAALAAGAEAKLLPLTVAVLDTGGHQIALKRQDGSGILRVDMISIGEDSQNQTMGSSMVKVTIQFSQDRNGKMEYSIIGPARGRPRTSQPIR